MLAESDKTWGHICPVGKQFYILPITSICKICQIDFNGNFLYSKKRNPAVITGNKYKKEIPAILLPKHKNDKQ